MFSKMWKNIVVLVIYFFFFHESNAKLLVPALFVFGDSLVDVGNNNHLKLSLLKANFPHNGVDYPGGKATGRFSNGRNSADFLAQKLGFGDSPPPYLSLGQNSSSNTILNGVNFASGGAGILDENSGGSISVNKQVQYFTTVYGNLVAKLNSTHAQKTVAESLFVMVIGSNDLFGYFKSNSKLSSKYSHQQYLDLLVSTLKTQLQTIYNLGARRLVSIGVGPIGCTPSQRSEKSKNGDCIEEENDMALKFNAELKSLVGNLSSTLPGFHYAFVNTYGVVSKYIQNPTAYGFKDVSAACCGGGKLRGRIACIPLVKYCSNRREHLFWDLYHPSEIVSQMLTDTVFDGSVNDISPINVKQLISS